MVRVWFGAVLKVFVESGLQFVGWISLQFHNTLFKFLVFWPLTNIVHHPTWQCAMFLIVGVHCTYSYRSIHSYITTHTTRICQQQENNLGKEHFCSASRIDQSLLSRLWLAGLQSWYLLAIVRQRIWLWMW